jgi:chromosome partitioning protein
VIGLERPAPRVVSGGLLSSLNELSTGQETSSERGYPQMGRTRPQLTPSINLCVSRETAERSVPTVTDPRTIDAAAPNLVLSLERPTPDPGHHSDPPVAALVPRSSSAAERPEHTRVFVVANQKGGVGKTTSTVNVAAAMAQLGQKVLVVDLDPQGNASTALNVDHRRGVPSTYDLVVDSVPMTDVVVRCPDLPELWVAPATIDLAGAEIELVSVVARESRLFRALESYGRLGSAGLVGEERLDYIFIDCPPSLGLLTLNALVAGVELMIPIQAEYYALEGLGQLMETVEMVRKHLNPRLSVSTILLTMYDARTRLAAGVAEEVREHFGDQVLRTSIPRSVRVSEAPSYAQTVMTYDPGSPGALSYFEAAREIAAKGVSS